MKKDFTNIEKAVHLGNAMYSKGRECSSEPGEWFVRNISALYYMCRPTVTQRKAQIFFSKPDPKTAIGVSKEIITFPVHFCMNNDPFALGIKVWNMMDKTYIYGAVKIALPSIKYCKKIFLDRGGICFTKEKVIQGMRDNTLNSITPWSVEEKLPLDELDSASNTYYGRLFKKDK